MTGLPKWDKLQNEVGPWNDFSIVRGKEHIILGEDVWVGYFCLIDGSGGLKIGDNVTISSGVHVLTHDSSKYRQQNLVKDPINGNHIDRAPVKIGNNILGKKMSANPLSLKTPTTSFGSGSEEIKINGSVPQAIAKTDIWNFINKKEPGKYIQGQLLSHNLNGPGNRKENLTRRSKSLNSKMESSVVSHAKGKILGE